MYEKIGESLPQLLQTERLFREDTGMRRVLSLVYKDILEFHRLAMKYFKQPSTWGLLLIGRTAERLTCL